MFTRAQAILLLVKTADMDRKCTQGAQTQQTQSSKRKAHSNLFFLPISFNKRREYHRRKVAIKEKSKKHSGDCIRFSH